jgi:TnpA family transposase
MFSVTVESPARCARSLFWLLGYQFSPRLADLGDAKLWRIDRKADYGPFNSLRKGSIEALISG